MLRFKELLDRLEENAAPRGEKLIKKIKVGKEADVMLTKRKNKVAVYVNGTFLDTYKSEAEAEKSAEDFAKLMGK